MSPVEIGPDGTPIIVGGTTTPPNSEIKLTDEGTDKVEPLVKEEPPIQSLPPVPSELIKPVLPAKGREIQVEKMAPINPKSEEHKELVAKIADCVREHEFESNIPHTHEYWQWKNQLQTTP